MYEYSTLPNSWEEQNITWDHYYAEQFLGGSTGSLGQTEFEMMCITMRKAVEQLEVTAELEETHLPRDVYDVYLRRHFEGRELPCQQQLI